MIYLVILIDWKNKFSNYSTFTLKFTEHFIHSTGHFNLFYCAKSTILLNTIYLQINF
jgi:hypothetical protein